MEALSLTARMGLGLGFVKSWVALKKLLFLAVLLMASTGCATDQSIPSFHKPLIIRKLNSMEYRAVGKAELGGKPEAYDIPWKGGYDPPNNNR